MKVLLFCDDEYHPGDVPEDGTCILSVKGYDMEIIWDPAGFDPAILPNYGAVIMSKSDHVAYQSQQAWKTEAIQEAFVQYVENGGGLVVTHSGLVAGKGNSTAKLDALIGSRFAFHPNQNNVVVGVLKPHPVTAGVGMFTEKDEHYRLEILADDIEILAASYGPPQGEAAKYATDPYFNDPGDIAPAVYVRTQGKGRVCVITPGHNLEVWHNPEFQTLLENALKWCAKQ